MSGERSVTVAAVQAAPVFLDLDATVERTCELVAEAAGLGARLIVFPEAFLPGYPDWVWRLPAWDDGTWYKRLYEQAVEIPGPAPKRLGQAARDTNTWLAVGVDEKGSSGTVYCTLLYIDPSGNVAGVHRKLMPTGGERTVWGQGDGSTLTVVDTDFGRVGGLICWENYMPLARQAMYQQGVDIYVAPTWDSAETGVATIRHIAKEGRVFVVSVNMCMRGSDVPDSLPGMEDIYHGADDWLSHGRSMIAGPEGEILAGPLVDEPGILTATIDLGDLALARRAFDPVGHYSRPDVFRFTVTTQGG